MPSASNEDMPILLAPWAPLDSPDAPPGAATTAASALFVPAGVELARTVCSC